jgi:flavin reductase (DIM6/NTAB) family NADH-FMN oxidoreductase RutF
VNPAASLDVREYRRALGAFATGVAVVTTADGCGGVIGITINSFTSVSLDPPLVLWCLDDASDRRDPFVVTERFCVNILGADDSALSDRFAKGEEYRLGPEELDPTLNDPPRLRHALSRLACTVRQRTQVGDHLVIIGEVTEFDAGEGDGLLYFRGRYARARLEA